jgi:hypothetical protein
MGNRAKSLFYSVLFNKYHRRSNLIELLFSNLVFLSLLDTQNFEIFSPKGTSHTNSDSEWENESFIQQISQ